MVSLGYVAIFLLGYSSGIVSWVMAGRQIMAIMNVEPSSSMMTSTCHSILHNNNSNSNRNSSFDQVVTQVYELSFATAEKVRNTFNLTMWDKTTAGGLMDLDRLAIAKYYSSSQSVFEWGLGESTYIASHVGVPRYAGIDSDAMWVNMARNQSLDHFRFYYGDIGSTKEWGYPTNPSLVKTILDYQLAPLIVEPHPFDVYMVDGRYRVACIMLAFLHASARGAPMGETVVLLHDCYHKERSGTNYDKAQHREYYDVSNHLLELVDHSGYKLCVYKRKSTTTDEQLLEMWKSTFRELGRKM
jgi:hypothetical protein